MGSNLWSAAEIALATNGKVIGDKSWGALGVSIDSRSICAGDLFIAVQAERDGHDFVAQAIGAGAAGALVSNPDVPGPKVLVSDTQSALEALAIAARNRSTANRIAVTGSVGKTSVKDALATVLAPDGATHKSVKSYNNQWGVPLTLARMPKKTKHAVFEVGTNHPGEIAQLSNLVQPHIGIITRIAQAHLAGFGSVAAIAREKASLWAALVDGGTAVYPTDDATKELLLTQARYFGVKNLLGFGHSAGSDVRILDWETKPGHSYGAFEVLGKRIQITAPVTGMHWAEVLAAVMAACVVSSVDPQDVADNMGAILPPEGRGDLIKLPLASGTALLMDDSYNANPASMNAALDTLSRIPATRKLAVLGEMLELGDEAPSLHAALVWPLQSAGVSTVWCIGDLMVNLQQRLPAHRLGQTPTDINTLALHIYQELAPGDVILMKGSNGSGVHRICSQLQQISANNEVK